MGDVATSCGPRSGDGSRRTLPTRGRIVLPDEAHSSTPHELCERLEAERSGHPFLLFRNVTGRQTIVALDGARRITIGRRSTNDVIVDDRLVSRTHAALEQVGGQWTILDDGLSQNGTFVNDGRVRARLRLADGDVIRVGRTLLRYRAPSEVSELATGIEAEALAPGQLTDAERRILSALIRPLLGGRGLRNPADNQQIADELVISVEAVKSTLKHLFAKHGLSSLPRGEKRLRLAELALRSDLSGST